MAVSGWQPIASCRRGWCRVIRALALCLALGACTTPDHSVDANKMVDLTCRAAAIASAMGWTGSIDPERAAVAIEVMCD